MRARSVWGAWERPGARSSGSVRVPAGHQRLAAGLVARERAQVPLELGQLSVEQVDDLKRERDPLLRVDG